MSVRKRLDDHCTDCGRGKEAVDEIVPVVHGKVPTGKWFCGGCA